MSVNLNFLSTNVRCIFNKMDELLTFTRSCSESQNELSVIAVQETWADTSDPDSLYAIPGYKLIRADRQDYGGGVALYIAERFNTRVLTIPMTAAECIWTRISTGNLSLVVANIYRPPRSDGTLFCAELERSIKTARAEGDDLLLLGDFNAKNSAWLTTDRTDRLGDDIQTLLHTYGLTQHVRFPTYIHRQTPLSCLDLVISSLHTNDIHIQSLPPFGASDHTTISGHINNQLPPIINNSPPRSRSTTFWSWTDSTIHLLREALSRTNLNHHPNQHDPCPVDTFWRSWRDKVLSIAQEHCQVTRTHPPWDRKNVPARPWISKGLLKEIKDKHRKHRIYLHSRSPDDWNTFTAQRNRVTTLLRRAKSDFVNNSTASSTSLHRLMKHLTTATKQRIPELVSQATPATTPAQKAAALNEFFISQSKLSVANADEQTPAINTTPDILSPLQEISTSQAEVEKLLRGVDTNKSPGFDSIPNRLLKEAAKELAPSLSSLFNLSFQTGEIPQEWKDATITPVPKPGDPTQPTNYRPISLLSTTSKIQEKIAHQLLYKHITPHLPNQQSGFREKDGTEQQLARLVHTLSTARDDGKHVNACFFDLSKAFDRVWHAGLLAKLSHYGVQGNALEWFRRYLLGRRQRVQVDGDLSPFLEIPAGVPQGSVLGPLLFLVYTIDLPHACENPGTTCSQFADDTALISIARTLQDCTRNLQQSVTAAGDWLQRWHLLVNTKKTVILPFYHNNRPPEQLPQITLRNSPLTVAQKHKHLGIIFQHDLRWTEHVEYIVKKSLKSFNILFRLRSTLTSDSLSHIYQTYILPIFSYASNALTPLSHTSLDRLERLQRKAARICLHLPLYTHLEHSHLLHRIKWPTLFSRFKVKHILFAHSLRHNYAPPHILSLHTASNVQPSYNLRRSRTWHLPTPRTDRCLHSPLYKALHYFNCLPTQLREISSRTLFKSQISLLF
eukprot:scpid19225/ scgid33023/ Probable RNA-directed DNA polymerase from transposon X-element; Reverse transcriptase